LVTQQAIQAGSTCCALRPGQCLNDRSIDLYKPNKKGVRCASLYLYFKANFYKLKRLGFS